MPTRPAPAPPAPAPPAPRAGPAARLPLPASAVRSALSPDNLALIAAVARRGSMAAAARELGLVPSALSYRIRHIETTLDVLLFDRSSRHARPTAAGLELLRSSAPLLAELDALAQRLKRIASGWEPQLTLAADQIISASTLLDLCQAFDALNAPTQLKLRAETLRGTLDALVAGQADLALGVSLDAAAPPAGVRIEPLGEVPFVFAVAPEHPLAARAEPLADADIAPHRAVAVADSTPLGPGHTVGLLPGQAVLTVPTLEHKLQAQLRGMGCGFLPLPLAQPHLQAARLVAKAVQRGPRVARVGYAWRTPPSPAAMGNALAWWLQQLQQPHTRSALLHRSATPPSSSPEGAGTGAA